MDVFSWIWDNKEWIFSGVGGLAIIGLLGFLRRKQSPQNKTLHQSGGVGSQNMQAGRDVVSINLTTSPTPVQKQETSEEEVKALETMPELISEMRDDLKNPDAQFIREFFVLLNRNHVAGDNSKPRLRYYENDHPNLLGKLDVLEEHGYVTNVTTGSSPPIYRMTEKLVKHLRSTGKSS